MLRRVKELKPFALVAMATVRKWEKGMESGGGREIETEKKRKKLRERVEEREKGRDGGKERERGREGEREGGRERKGGRD